MTQHRTLPVECAQKLDVTVVFHHQDSAFPNNNTIVYQVLFLDSGDVAVNEKKIPVLWNLFFSEGSLSLLPGFGDLSSQKLEITIPLQTQENSGTMSTLLLCQPLSRFQSMA